MTRGSTTMYKHVQIRGIRGSLKNVLCQILLFQSFLDFGMSFVKGAVLNVSVNNRAYIIDCGTH